MRLLVRVGGHRRTGVQYKMLAGDEGREGLVRHWHVLHGAGLEELETERQQGVLVRLGSVNTAVGDAEAICMF